MTALLIALALYVIVCCTAGAAYLACLVIGIVNRWR